MDTKNRTDRLEKLKRELHFYYICYVPPRGLAGGLCLKGLLVLQFTGSLTLIRACSDSFSLACLEPKDSRS